MNQIIVHPATRADQATIRAIVRAARIGPFGLDWRRFLVAEDQGCIVGVGQLKPRKDGSQVLASIAVTPDYQGRGIGSQIIWALIAGSKESLYLFCRDELEGYYRRFGFQKAQSSDLPADLARQLWLGELFSRLLATLIRQHLRIIIMKRPAQMAGYQAGPASLPS